MLGIAPRLGRCAMIKWLVSIWKFIKPFIMSLFSKRNMTWKIVSVVVGGIGALFITLHFTKRNTTVQADKTNISATVSDGGKIEHPIIGDINARGGSPFIINEFYYTPIIYPSRIEDTSNEISLEGVKHPHKSAEEAAKIADATRHFTQALTYYDKGELDSAIEEYNKSIAAKELPEAYNNRGLAWAKKGELDKAIDDYNKAIELYPKSAAAYNNRGIAWVQKGELDKAIADFSKTIELNPNLAEAHYNRGNTWRIKASSTGLLRITTGPSN